MIISILKKLRIYLPVVGFIFLLISGSVSAAARESAPLPGEKNSFFSLSWQSSINQGQQAEKYPDKRKITPESLRLTLNEYSFQPFSAILHKGVDTWEWLNNLDDPYFNRYNLDMEVDPDDERLKLFWENKF